MTELHTITVQLHPSYDIHVGPGIIHHIRLHHRRIVVLADERLRDQHLPTVLAALRQQQSAEIHSVVLPAGESCKNLAVFSRTLSQLAQLGLSRDSAVVALGGGATSDLAGYVAASYLRGVAFYVLPTTVLAMVDASVGGKTGINLPEGKNLAGAFHQPRGVWADTELLTTLPASVFAEGMAEAFKHGLIEDTALINAILGQHWTAHSPGLVALVAQAICVKAKIVANDPHERHERAFLNYGHTLAHAVEAATHHTISHGDAVSYGLHYAAWLGKHLGMVDITAMTRAFIDQQRPQPLPELDFAELSGFMNRDKKADEAGLRFVLLEALAKPVLMRVDDATQAAAYADWWHDVKPTV
jgi:3-dehydroquinate synthase